MIHKKTLLFVLLSAASGALYAPPPKGVPALKHASLTRRAIHRPSSAAMGAAACVFMHCLQTSPSSRPGSAQQRIRRPSYRLQAPSPCWSLPGVSPCASSPSLSQQGFPSPCPSTDATGRHSMAELLGCPSAEVQSMNEFLSGNDLNPKVIAVKSLSGDNPEPKVIKVRFPPGDKFDIENVVENVVEVRCFSGDDLESKVVKVEFLSDDVASLLGDGSKPKIFIVTFASRNEGEPAICYFKFPPGD